LLDKASNSLENGDVVRILLKLDKQKKIKENDFLCIHFGKYLENFIKIMDILLFIIVRQTKKIKETIFLYIHFGKYFW
jgi:hypothetical protein